MLAALVLIFPLEPDLPTVFGISAGKFVILFLGAWAALVHHHRLVELVRKPIYLALVIFFAWAASNEAFHPTPSFEYLYRVAQMVLAASLIAAICSDLAAIRAALFGYAIGGFLLSCVICLSAYGKLSVATAQGFQEATAVRAEAFIDSPLQENLNRLSFVAAQGAVVCVAFALSSAARRSRIIFGVLGVVCLIGTFLPLSRGGAFTALIAIAIVLYGSRESKLKRIAFLALIPILLIFFVPKVAFQRMTLSTSDQAGREDSRIRLYKAAVFSVRDYVLAGVGAGNYWSHWGKSNGFGKHDGTLGAHNSFLQVLIFWGLPAVFSLGFVAFEAFRCLPNARSGIEVAPALIGISVSCLLFLLMSHNLYSKQLSMGLGLLMASGMVFARQSRPRVRKLNDRPSRTLAFAHSRRLIPSRSHRHTAARDGRFGR